MKLRTFVSGLALLATVSAPALAAEEVDLLIANVTVIDPQHETRIEGRDVVIDEGRIVAVVATGSGEFEAHSRVDGSGKYVIPGLMDMHVHTSIRPVHESSLKLMTANGVTGVREMGSDCVDPDTVYMCLGEMRESAAKIEAGEMVGPRLLALSTLKVDSNRRPDASEGQILYAPFNAEDGRATVAGLAARGPDLIKVSQEIHSDAFTALMAEAEARGVRVGGHVPMMFSIADVAGMGMDTIEHARDLPLDCSAFGSGFRDQIMRKLRGEDVAWPDRSKRPAGVRDSFDEALCTPHLEAMVANDTWYVPTHLTREMDFRAGEEAYRKDARLAYLVEMQVADWTRDLDRTVQASEEEVAALSDFFDLALKTTGMAHAAGVKIMAGTDANDTMVFPGFSLHDELGFMVRAGLTPMEALQTATSVPAQYLGREGDFGGVSEGKLADLVLLDADPTLDIANTKAIAAVVQGGVVRDRAALDALLAEVRERKIAADAQMSEAKE
ncbi:amidohydrolase family protein [Qipengyuania aurantiaca]|uniref:Amidohydrolase family protein n=1 Tax=Qipengyuania aurantiaca TaxID=2867233 RepID=A0ABX8ZLZ1_9SPHN|nr:amidohydrolase family protein [Qipengyuania aurantiaca]QZD89991.1 amidohydrolase family protein [Qipengyuania aurantiaca]